MKTITGIILLAGLVVCLAASGQSVKATSVGDLTSHQNNLTTPALAPNAQGCNGTPVIQYAVANPPTISPGQVTTLQWGLVGNAQAAFLQFPNGHRQGIGTPGSQQVNPRQTSTYFIVGVCGPNQVQVPITVTVNNPPGCQGAPQLNGFTANPSTIQGGQASTLSWGPVNNAQYVQLSSQGQGGSGVPTPGSITVNPTQTTTYFLTAWCQSNSVQAQVVVTVSNPPPPPPPPQGNRITGITRNGGLSNANRLVLTVNYYWDGQDSPATLQATAHNASGGQVGQSNATRIDPNREFFANVNMTPAPRGMTSVTACIIGRSGSELVCQSVPMQ